MICLLCAFGTDFSAPFELPVCNQEQFINQLLALPLEDQFHIIHQVIQNLPPELQPVQNLPAHEQAEVQQQQLQEILQYLQDALDNEQANPHNPMDEMD